MKVQTKKFCKNAVIYLEGNTNIDNFYIIKSGKVKITRKNDILGIFENTRTAGYIFGIIQCITGIPENERVEAVTDCELIIIEKKRLEDLYKFHPSIIMKILSQYSDILRELDKDLVEHDFFYNFIGRNEKIYKFALEYIKYDKKKYAAHLIKSFLGEENKDTDNLDNILQLEKELPDIEVITTSNIIETKTVPAGTILFCELETGSVFYVLKFGRVKITKIKQNNDVTLAILGPGAVFGEMAILNDKPRSATAVVEEDSDIMIIDKKGVNDLPPNIFVSILEKMTQRIWMVQQQLIAYKLPSPTARLYYFLTANITQHVKNLKKESESGYKFQFSIDELYSMLDLSDKDKKSIGDFLEDKNFDFGNTQIKVKKIGELINKNAYYYSRDLMQFR